ncbi:MAG: hypothetical protein ACM3RP_10835 [Chitinophagales bacterium]
MRHLWRGLLLGSLAGGAAYLLWRRSSRRKQERGLALVGEVGREAVKAWGRQVRDVQGAVRVGRRIFRKRKTLRTLAHTAHRLTKG